MKKALNEPVDVRVAYVCVHSFLLKNLGVRVPKCDRIVKNIQGFGLCDLGCVGMARQMGKGLE
jgi:hypothetical protein